MTSILLQIRQKWCDKIASGEKTIELRRTIPDTDVPFKCYIYQEIRRRRDTVTGGLIIGEFVCDRITKWVCAWDSLYHVSLDEMSDMCMTSNELYHYGKCRPLFGLHISQLKIYDTPKQLSEFHGRCTQRCKYSVECGETNDGRCMFGISKAPKSWMYVE